MAILLGTAAWVTALVAGLVVGFLVRESWPAWRELGARLLGPRWAPSAARYGLLPMAAGSVLVTAVAVALAAPVGIAYAVAARELAPPWLARVLRRVLTLMAAVPSVVYGLWGLTTLVPLLARWRPPGTSVLAAGLVLCLMILPTIALLVDGALEGVPLAQRHSAAALSLGLTTTLRHVLWPLTRQAVISAVALGTARAVGETMAVLLVIGNVPHAPDSLLASARTLTGHIALEMPYAQGLQRSALFAAGLLLAVVVLVLSLWATGSSATETRDG